MRAKVIRPFVRISLVILAIATHLLCEDSAYRNWSTEATVNGWYKRESAVFEKLAEIYGNGKVGTLPYRDGSIGVWTWAVPDSCVIIAKKNVETQVVSVYFAKAAAVHGADLFWYGTFRLEIELSQGSIQEIISPAFGPGVERLMAVLDPIASALRWSGGKSGIDPATILLIEPERGLDATKEPFTAP